MARRTEKHCGSWRQSRGRVGGCIIRPKVRLSFYNAPRQHRAIVQRSCQNLAQHLPSDESRALTWLTRHRV